MRSTVHNVGGWTARHAARTPGRLALVDGARRLDHAALDARIARAAGALAARGVGRTDRVALALGNRSAHLEVMLAAARLGAVAVPLNTRLSSGELAFVLGDCRPSVIVAEAALRERVCEAALQAGRGDTRLLWCDDAGAHDEYEDAIRSAAPHAPVPVAPDEPMSLLYTSGTTGTPKGALLPHRKTFYNALNAALYLGLRPGAERVLVFAPLFHSLGSTILALPALYAGGAVVLQRRFDPEAVWDAVEREGITCFGGVPTHHQRLLEALEAPRLRDASRMHASLRLLFGAGAAIDAATVERYAGHGLLLVQGYGQTETSTLCCLAAEDALLHAGSVGRAVFHVDLRLVDPGSIDGDVAGWRDVAPGTPGEIVAKGPTTMLGYWERPRETAATLRGEWLRTGDLARRDEQGFVTLCGRARDLYISGGENVYPAEVEAVLSQHPAVREIAVVGVPDPRWGEAGRAHVVLEPGQTLDLADLHAFARTRLARFKLPRELVIESGLPRTASGKVRRHCLRDAAPSAPR